jgi:predicted DNA-binding transcriptional regulator AlpA
MLGEREAAERLGVSLSTMIRHRRDGTGPRWFRIGQRSKGIRYRLDDLTMFLAERAGRQAA